MKKNTLLITLLIAGLSFALPALGLANTAVSTTGVNGYDLVSYQTGEKPLRGNGNHVATVDGVNYLFASEKNKQSFEADPQKFLPEYGGYCAYGAAVGKKFVGDPDVWKVVDGKLYLNLDNSIQGIWNKDIKGNIKKADKHWKEIKNVPADQL